MKKNSRLTRYISASIALLIGSFWLLAVLDLVPIDENYFEPILTILPALTIILGLITFIPDSDNTEKETPEQVLINAVQNSWIDSVLKDTLRDAQIEIGIKTSPEQINRISSYELPVELHLNNGKKTIPLEHTADILLKTFYDTDQQLLILGAPGSGKSVLLLQLAERLLTQAKEGNPIPVIFNLASWAEKQESITDWLIKRFKTDYGISEKIVKKWMKGDTLIYLLDGFDEVAQDHQQNCLDKLNKFITADRQLVICSRNTEYQALSKPLKTQFAIQIQALPSEKFFARLHESIPPKTMPTIQKFIESDNDLLEEINKPLFINILINTYADGRPFTVEDNQDATTLDKIQQNIITPYIKRQLQNNPTSEYTNENTRRYLSWIANNLRQRDQTIFYIEMLQSTWLPHPQASTQFKAGMVLIFGLILGLIFGLIGTLNGALSYTLSFGLILGLSFGLIFGLDDIDIERKFDLNRKTLSFTLIVGLSGALNGALGFTLLGALLGALFDTLSYPMSYTLSGGLGVGLIFGLIFALRGKTTLTYRAEFNRGLRDSVILGLGVGLGVGGLSFGLSGGLNGALNGALILGLSGALIGALSFGLDNVLKHIILRAFLERQNVAPHRFDKFLLHAIDRSLMRRVGGSAIFKHRYILEYFADYWDEEYASEFTP